MSISRSLVARLKASFSACPNSRSCCGSPPVDGAAIELEVPFADRFERLGESTNALGLMLNAPFSAAQSRPDVDLLRGMGGLKPLESFDILPEPRQLQGARISRRHGRRLLEQRCFAHIVHAAKRLVAGERLIDEPLFAPDHLPHGRLVRPFVVYQSIETSWFRFP